MTEKDFWGSLEYRISHEFAEMQNHDLRQMWCDGLIPEHYHLTGQPPRIKGQAWIVTGQEQESWQFTLLLPAPVTSREEIEWPSLLPPRDVTRWFGIDRGRKHIEIEPSAAVPDPN